MESGGEDKQSIESVGFVVFVSICVNLAPFIRSATESWLGSMLFNGKLVATQWRARRRGGILPDRSQLVWKDAPRSFCARLVVDGARALHADNPDSSVSKWAKAGTGGKHRGNASRHEVSKASFES